MTKTKISNASVVDLFCGVGGLTHGFHKEGFPIAAGIDIEEACRFPYESNNHAPFICKDVSLLTGEEVNALFSKNGARILVGCAPCQPFSTYNHKNEDPNWKLLGDFAKIIRESRPDVVSMENVPSLLTWRGGKVFQDFRNALEEMDYHVAHGVLFGPDFGLPQTRSRLVLIASRLGGIELPEPTHQDNPVTVKDAIGALPRLAAGEAHPSDPLHRASRLSEINLQRIKASTPGGSWKDWDDDLVAQCHKVDSGKSYASVYGRMEWDAPSPTITTQFFGFGNGRFGHPEQNRALSLREGAILQSFPANYKFIAPGEKVQFKRVGRMIGNAVPVALGQAIARTITEHLKEHAHDY